MNTHGFVNSIKRQIRRSQRHRAILFTDIEGSTGFWDRHGDVKGRLMVDAHNRMVFPVIRANRGTIVKTIGDAVMASFRDPERALRAAIGIQQALELRRQEDKSFKQRVRIGIHAGKTIVEDRDVFGDTVNVAARVESMGKGDEILISAGAAARLKRSDYHLVKKGAYVPRGKSDSITVYRCQWKECPSMIEGISFSPTLPVGTRQKAELLAYAAVTAAFLYFLSLHYLRYFLSDSEAWALVALDPLRAILDRPLAVSMLAVLVIGCLALVVRIRTVPHLVLRALKGGFGYGLLFLALLAAMKVVPFAGAGAWNRLLYESRHLFVEVLENGAVVREAPDRTAQELKSVQRGGLLLLTDVAESGGITWNKVLVAEKEYGWIPRIVPARIGEPERRVTLAYKFRFRATDAGMLVLSLAGFVWGYLNFRLKPA